MKQSNDHSRQTGGAQRPMTTLAQSISRLFNNGAAVAMLPGLIVGVAGTVLLLILVSRQRLSDGWLELGLFVVWLFAIAVVCLVAYLQNRRQHSQFLSSIDPARLHNQQSRMQEMAALDADFCELRDRLCQGIGGKEAQKWRAQIDSATFPRAKLKDVVDQWLRWLFSSANPFHELLQDGAEEGVPLPGERRAAHMTAAWYADQAGRAARKATAPAWRSFVDYALNALVLLTFGGAVWLFFVSHASVSTIAIACGACIFMSLIGLMWSTGTIHGEVYAWRIMARHLIVELHTSTPHDLQPDCFDYSCQNGQAASST